MFLNYHRSSCDIDCHKITLEIDDNIAHINFYSSTGHIAHRVGVCEPTGISYSDNEAGSYKMKWMDGFLENNKKYTIMEVDNNDSDTTKSTKTSKE